MEEGDTCPFCRKRNSQSHTRCSHFIAFVWDDWVDCAGVAKDFEQAWDELHNRLCDVDDDEPALAVLIEEVRSDVRLRSVLGTNSFRYALTDLSDVQSGGGWSTGGMMGGSGYNLYMKHPKRLGVLADLYRKFVARVEAS